jgi:hypothetical protein
VVCACEWPLAHRDNNGKFAVGDSHEHLQEMFFPISNL